MSLILYSKDPCAIPRLYQDLVEKILMPLAKRIEAEERRLGRRLTPEEVDRLIREVLEEVGE